MEAPQAPVDLKIILGNEDGCQNLLNLNVGFFDNKDKVKQHLLEKKVNEDFGNNCLVFFDLYIQPGKEKQALEYFAQKDGENKSPLQIIFSNRPTEMSQFCKFEMQLHQNFVRLQYEFLPSQGNEEYEFIEKILQTFQTNGVKLESNINFDLKGSVAHNKKNRANVKVNYTKFHLVSNAFCSQKLFDALGSIDQFIEDGGSEILNQPFVQLLRKSKIVHANIKMDSFRKINKFYRQVNGETKQHETKEFKYINQQIFRQRAEASIVFKSQYLIKVVGLYEGEDIFIRLIKVYSKFVENMLDVVFYDD